jgi:hypothetical protein
MKWAGQGIEQYWIKGVYAGFLVEMSEGKRKLVGNSWTVEVIIKMDGKEQYGRTRIGVGSSGWLM